MQLVCSTAPADWARIRNSYNIFRKPENKNIDVEQHNDEESLLLLKVGSWHYEWIKYSFQYFFFI